MDNKLEFNVNISCEGDINYESTYENDIYTLSIVPNGKALLKEVSVKIQFDFEKDDRLFLNGYQSWTDVREYGVKGRMRGLRRVPKFLIDKYHFNAYGDYDFVKYPYKKGYMHGFSYAYIRNNENKLFIGSLDERSCFTVIIFDTTRNEITLKADLEDLEISDRFDALKVAFIFDEPDFGYEKYFSLMGIKKREKMPLTGYTSWYNHYQDINEKVIYNDLEALNNFPVKMDIFQIDDGFQTAVGDWLSIDANKFPNGMKPVADKIKEDGFVSGIWLAPFVCEKTSLIYKNHPDWILKKDGEFVAAGCNWSTQYALDIYNEEVREYLRKVFDTVINDWGFKMLKLDFLYAACMLPRKDKTRGRIMCEAIDFIRGCAPKAIILGCGVPLWPVFGRVEYCRIGCDMGLDWNDKLYMRAFHRERVSTRNSILNSLFMRGIDGYAFGNDPDVFLLRDYNIELTDTQKLLLAKVNALCGTVLFTSDDVSTYDAEKKAKYKEALGYSAAKILDVRIDQNVVTIEYVLNDQSEKMQFSI